MWDFGGYQGFVFGGFELRKIVMVGYRVMCVGAGVFFGIF